MEGEDKKASGFIAILKHLARLLQQSRFSVHPRHMPGGLAVQIRGAKPKVSEETQEQNNEMTFPEVTASLGHGQK